MGPVVALLALSGCALFLPMAGYPPAALRKEAPEGIEAKAVKVGEPAPKLMLPGTRGEFVLGDRPAGSRALVVFYRGDW